MFVRRMLNYFLEVGSSSQNPLSTATRRRNPSIVETMVLLSAGHWPVYILRFYYEKPNTNIDEPMM